MFLPLTDTKPKLVFTWDVRVSLSHFQFIRKVSMMSVCEQEEAAEMISEWPVIEQEVHVPGMI